MADDLFDPNLRFKLYFETNGQVDCVRLGRFISALGRDFHRYSEEGWLSVRFARNESPLVIEFVAVMANLAGISTFVIFMMDRAKKEPRRAVSARLAEMMVDDRIPYFEARFVDPKSGDLVSLSARRDEIPAIDALADRIKPDAGWGYPPNQLPLPPASLRSSTASEGAAVFDTPEQARVRQELEPDTTMVRVTYLGQGRHPTVDGRAVELLDGSRVFGSTWMRADNVRFLDEPEGMIAVGHGLSAPLELLGRFEKGTTREGGLAFRTGETRFGASLAEGVNPPPNDTLVIIQARVDINAPDFLTVVAWAFLKT